MVRTELDRIHLVFENCEYLDVPGKDVTQLSIRGITKSGSGANLWWSGYTIDVMNITDGTIQDQWVGDTYSDFLADFEELKNEYCDLYTDVDE